MRLKKSIWWNITKEVNLEGSLPKNAYIYNYEIVDEVLFLDYRFFGYFNIM